MAGHHQRWLCSFLVLPTILSFSFALNNFKINHHLIITSTKNPVAGVPNLTATQSGIFEAVLLDVLAAELNFTYEVRPPKDVFSAGVLLPNGSWTGANGQLQRREVDMCASTTSPSLATRLVVDTSYPVYFIDTALLIPYPTEEAKAHIIITPFQGIVWGFFVLSVVYMVIAMWAIHRLTNERINDTSQSGLDFWAMYVGNILTTQGGAVSMMKNSNSHFRLAGICTIVASWFLCNYYLCAYTSLLTVPIYKPVVNSIEELAQSSIIKPMTIKGSSVDNYVMSSKHPAVGKVGDKLRKYPEQRSTRVLFVEDIATLIQNSYALIVTTSAGETLIQKSYDLNRKVCRVSKAPQTFWNHPQSYTFPKDSPYIKLFDREIMLLQQSGLFDRAQKAADYMANRNPCSVFHAKRRQEQDRNGLAVPLRLKDMVGAFYALVAGLALAILAFVVERVTARIRKMKF